MKRKASRTGCVIWFNIKESYTGEWDSIGKYGLFILPSYDCSITKVITPNTVPEGVKFGLLWNKMYDAMGKGYDYISDAPANTVLTSSIPSNDPGNSDPGNDDSGNNNSENNIPDNTPEPAKAGNANDVSDAFAPVHSNDGSNSAAGSVSSGNAAWSFDPDKSVTVIVVKQVDISKKLETLTKAEGYDSSAKHRYSVDDKKKAKVDKKGILKPKKSGQIKVSLEQKVKGSGWTKVGEPIALYIQLPEMQKKDSQTVAVGATLDAFKYLGHTTYRPNKWISTKPDVASIDENTGIITVHKKGTTKIIAEYGEGKNGSGKKYATKLKIVTGG